MSNTGKITKLRFFRSFLSSRSITRPTAIMSAVSNPISMTTPSLEHPVDQHISFSNALLGSIQPFTAQPFAKSHLMTTYTRTNCRPQIPAENVASHTRMQAVATTTKPTLPMENVMHPTASSILERRAKALSEGRRQDAKLSETERRIIRHLRNRESAERCRLRRAERARILRQKLVMMENENKRLTELSKRYRNTISCLEEIIRSLAD